MFANHLKTGTWLRNSKDKQVVEENRTTAGAREEREGKKLYCSKGIIK